MKRTVLVLLSVLAFASLCLAQPPVPSYVMFAGEKVSLGTHYRYERMDRELLSFTYMHTSSILILKRSERIFSRVVPILREEGVPEDLKYLMVVESSLDPKAYSSAGAAGLWQFTKATAIDFGLEVTATVDERYNIELETRAACRYLLEAYRKYGSWITVAASYNAGRRAVDRRIENQGQTYGMDLYLPEETARYMFRLLSAKMFVENPSAFGFSVTERYPCEEPSEVIMVSDPVIDLVKLAEYYDVTYADLRRANLWIRDIRIENKSCKTYRIVIPDVYL